MADNPLMSDARQRIAMMMMQNGADTSPIQSWTQGAARIANAITGGMMLKSQRDENKAALAGLVNSLASGDQASPAASPAMPQAAPTSASPADAIAKIESGGDYNALGPVTKTGDRAYGKYQVMGANVPDWTKTFLGNQMTPQQFAASPQAQDAVFNGKFGEYSQKYGPEGAARAWFAGEGGMNNPNAKDQLGTSVAQYGQKFAQAANPNAPMFTAPNQAQPTIPPNVRQTILSAISSDSPMAQQIGVSLLGKYIQPHTPVAVQPGGTLVDPISGKVVFGGGEKPTNDITNYHQAVAQGYKGSLTDWMSQMKQAGSQRVTIDQRAPTSFEQTYGENQAKSAVGVIDAGNKASSVYQRNQMLRALNDAISTGKVTPAQATIGAWAKSVGVDPASLGIDPNLPTNAQTFAALSNESMMSKLGPGGFPSQNFSDTDRKFLEKTVTNLGDTPQANEMKLAVSDRISQLQMEKANRWQEISTSVDAKDRAAAYEKFERDWRKEMKTRNVFGDLTAKIGAPGAPQGGLPQGWSVQVH